MSQPPTLHMSFADDPGTGGTAVALGVAEILLREDALVAIEAREFWVSRALRGGIEADARGLEATP